MILRIASVAVAWAFLAPALVQAAEPSYRVETVKEIPDGLADAIAQLLEPQGVRISGADGVVGEIWLAKSVEVKPDFKPTLSVKYPFQPGALIGALHVSREGTFQDFRTQELKPGVYTLRYGQQPVDGNHIGTSDLADFLLALPAATDEDPATIFDFDALAQKSAESAGSSHPAILSLQPPAKDESAPALTHNESDDFWMLQVVVTGKADNVMKKVPMRLVVVGHADE